MRTLSAVTLALVVLVCALAYTDAQAATTCHLKAVKVTAHKYVKVKKVDRHGHAIKRHGHYVYKMRRTRSGKLTYVLKRVAYKKTIHKRLCFQTPPAPTLPKPTLPAPTAPVAPVVTHLRAKLDPTCTQPDPATPLVVRCYVSAAAQTGDGVGVQSIPNGVLALYIDGSLVGALNVGADVQDGYIDATVSGLGTHTTSLIYSSGDMSAVDNETITVGKLVTYASVLVDAPTCALVNPMAFPLQGRCTYQVHAVVDGPDGQPIHDSSAVAVAFLDDGTTTTAVVAPPANGPGSFFLLTDTWDASGSTPLDVAPCPPSMSGLLHIEYPGSAVYEASTSTLEQLTPPMDGAYCTP